MNEGVVESYVENVPIVLLFVCAVIVSPIFEELLFRKIIVRKATTIWKSYSDCD